MSQNNKRFILMHRGNDHSDRAVHHTHKRIDALNYAARRFRRARYNKTPVAFWLIDHGTGRIPPMMIGLDVKWIAKDRLDLRLVSGDDEIAVYRYYRGRRETRKNQPLLNTRVNAASNHRTTANPGN